jgi:hypothetical protein
MAQPPVNILRHHMFMCDPAHLYPTEDEVGYDMSSAHLGHVLSHLSQMKSRQELKDYVDNISVVQHFHFDDDMGRLMSVPGVQLKNAHWYTLQCQDCIDDACTRRAFSVRIWDMFRIMEACYPPLLLKSFTTVKPAFSKLSDFGNAQFPE